MCIWAFSNAYHVQCCCVMISPFQYCTQIFTFEKMRTVNCSANIPVRISQHRIVRKKNLQVISIVLFQEIKNGKRKGHEVDIKLIPTTLTAFTVYYTASPSSLLSSNPPLLINGHHNVFHFHFFFPIMPQPST